MQGKHASMSALVIILILAFVFFVLDPVFVLTLIVLSLIMYGYLKSK